MAKWLQKEEGDDTKEKLIIAAERLFARRGINAISTKQVLDEANQRNASAVQYHFGSLQALTETVLQRGIAASNKARFQLLEELKAEHPGGGLPNASIAQAVVLPAFGGTTSGKQSFFRRFFFQLYSTSGLGGDLGLHPSEVALKECFNQFAKVNFNVPENALKAKFRMAIGLINNLSALFEGGFDTEPTGADKAEADFQILLAIDSVASILNSETSSISLALSERVSHECAR